MSDKCTANLERPRGRHQSHNAYVAGVAEGRRLERREHGWTGHDPEFAVGQKVRKVGGRYGGPGRIVGFSEDLDNAGYRLYQVAMRVEGGYGEFVHVFPAAALRADDESVVATSNPNAPASGILVGLPKDANEPSDNKGNQP